jgi:hypothetical protein
VAPAAEHLLCKQEAEFKPSLIKKKKKKKKKDCLKSKSK